MKIYEPGTLVVVNDVAHGGVVTRGVVDEVLITRGAHVYYKVTYWNGLVMTEVSLHESEVTSIEPELITIGFKS